MLFPYNGLVAKPMDHPAFQRRIESESYRYKPGLKIKWELYLEKSGPVLCTKNAGRNNVYTGDSVPHLADSSPGNSFTTKVHRILSEISDQ
jgi:hypothetical protein